MDPLDLNLRHVRAAAAIFRDGSVGAASRSIHLTQPAITQGLAKLERVLGHSLFERRSNGMTPTAAAGIAVPRFEAALALIGHSRVTAAQARSFLDVVKSGGYAAAARRGGLSNASLHRATSDLAAALGCQLLERRGDGVAPTRRGAELFRRLSLARGELASALDELETLSGREIGRLVVGAMPLSRAKLLPTALGRFHAHHPDFLVSVVEGGHSDLVGPLRDGDVDVMIGALRNLSSDEDLVEHPLLVDRPVILGRAGHPLAGTAPDIGLLARYPWSVAGPGAPLRAQWERMFADAGVERPRVPIECGSVMAIRELLVGGDFLTMLSADQVAAELAAGWLAIISETPPTVVRTIGTTVRRSWTPTRLQRGLLEALEAVADELRSQNPMGKRAIGLEESMPHA